MQKQSLILISALIFFGVLTMTVVGTANEGIFFSDLEHLRSVHPEFTRAYKRIHIFDAWKALRDNPDPNRFSVVGVIDSGVDASHPEFRGSRIDNNLIGAVNLGRTAPRTDAKPLDGGHGTSVMGIIGASNLSDDGITLSVDSPQMNGILSGALSEDHYIVGLRRSKFLAAEGDFDVDVHVNNLARGKAAIINISAGRKDDLSNPAFLKLIEEYREVFKKHSEIIFVLAAGNDGQDTSTFVPANVVLPVGSGAPVTDNVIVVGSTSVPDDDQEPEIRAKWDPGVQESNYGAGVSIAAPGEKIYTTAIFDPPVNREPVINDYRYPDYFRDFGNGITRSGFFRGTSAAAPMVTGVAGLIKSIKPELTPAQIKQILIESADPIQTGETDKRLGTGCYSNPNDTINTGCRLNAERAVCHPLVLNCVPTCPQGQYTAEYFSDTSADNPFPGQFTIQRCENAPLNQDWGLNSPDPAISSENFSARWTGTFTFLEDNTYIFQAITDDGMRVYLDNTPIIDAWFDQSRRSHWISLPVAAGTHTVKIEYYEHFINAVAMLDWYIAPPSPQPPSLPCPEGAWTAEYFTDSTSQEPFPGNPDSITCEPFPLNNDWGQGSLAATISSDHFSARYTGTFSFDQDITYKFNGITDDGMRIFIDNIEVYNAWGLHNRFNFEFLSTLNTGTHTIRVEYFEQTGNAVAIFSWEPYVTLISLNAASTQAVCRGYTCISAWGFREEEE